MIIIIRLLMAPILWPIERSRRLELEARREAMAADRRRADLIRAMRSLS